MIVIMLLGGHFDRKSFSEILKLIEIEAKTAKISAEANFANLDEKTCLQSVGMFFAPSLINVSVLKALFIVNIAKNSGKMYGPKLHNYGRNLYNFF